MTPLRQLILRMTMFTLFGACPLLLSSQNIDIQNDDSKPIEEKLVYTRQNSLNIAIHSQGFGVGFKIGKIKTINISEYYTRPYVYGKLNSVFVARFGYGQEKRIFGKPYWGGIETMWTYEFGASLALMKPYYYYVAVYESTENGNYQEVIEEQTFGNHEQWLGIFGRSAFTKGLTETKLSPGVHASMGLCFEIGKQRTRLQAINVKVIAEGFPLGAPIMDGQRNKWVYVTFHLSYNWGSRFNKY